MDSSWVEKIPVEEFDDVKNLLMTQLSATKWSRNMEFYRKTHSPLNATHLMRFMYSKVVWWDEEVFLMTRKLPTTVKSKFRKGTSKIDLEYGKVYVYGMTKQSVAQTIEEMLYLMDETSDVVRIGRYSAGEARSVVPTTFITSRFLAEYMKVNPKRRLYFGCGCKLSAEESVALASHPEPLNVGLECTFADQGHAFVEALARRTTHFGTIAAHESGMYSSFGYLFEVKSALANISLETTTRFFQDSQRRLPLSLPTKHLDYRIYDAIQLGENQSLAIVSRAITLRFELLVDPLFHTQFLLASGNLQELGIIYKGYDPLSLAQQAELLQAIRTNQNLYRLELGCLTVLRPFWDDLLAVIASHSRLRAVVFRQERHQIDLEQVKSLIPFAHNQIHLDVTVEDRGPWLEVVREMRAVLAPVRYLNDAKAMTRESIDDRPAIFGAALTRWTSGCFSRLYPLLTVNSDVLCTMLSDPPSLELQHQRKRQRQL
ncbi:hypothetical protein FisN_9Lh289 [Fistulifera solaris]|uniref:Uncharacterized protein n=1 Tax=Fistulifera solaris TaxID=1519565 RepID=A0A1Z5KKZ5_FISSO|nr:hypothetical protein FisN_9Lh289 [Fistulifera solaris]|eukprot:GAX26983.1 hypothetical protein FisN_9Lh289 [Fistulifera solaris]